MDKFYLLKVTQIHLQSTFLMMLKLMKILKSLQGTIYLRAVVIFLKGSKMGFGSKEVERDRLLTCMWLNRKILCEWR